MAIVLPLVIALFMIVTGVTPACKLIVSLLSIYGYSNLFFVFTACFLVIPYDIPKYICLSLALFINLAFLLKQIGFFAKIVYKDQFKMLPLLCASLQILAYVIYKINFI